MKGFGNNNQSKKGKIYPLNNKKEDYQILNKAIKCQSEGNIVQAIKCYEFLIKKEFQESVVFANYGIILINLGRLQEAEVSIRKAIELNPKDATLYSNLGGILKDLGKIKQAEVSIRKAIELNPKDALLHTNLGTILKDLGEIKQAEVSIRKAIELNPNYAIAHLNLGNILRDLGNFQEAALSTRKAIELNPNYAIAHLNLGNILRDLGNFQEAALSTRKTIELNPNNAIAHLNLGNILSDLGNLEEAELSTRKAIEINPNYAIAHLNLGNILRDLGNFQEAAISCCKAIEINSNLAEAYYSLSLIKYSDQNKIWKRQLFSEKILNNKLPKAKIDIYFARANILHKEKKYEESTKYLQLANDLKLVIKPSNASEIFNKSKQLLIESDKKKLNQEEDTNFPESIFIVGMPRSGSTLIESILSMRNDVYDLGEINILEESYLEWKESKGDIKLAELYEQKVNNNTQLNITTNKFLYNYQYAGIITNQIPNTKIIHCYRNPLDNILSIYRAHFAQGNQYSSSLVDCANVYLDQEEVMTEYKKRFRKKIYDLNYDSLVSNPKQEITSLISWLGWQWDDTYLSPHLNPRSVKTRSNVEVRYPINSKSVGGWKNYKDMLKPAMEIITQEGKYKDLKY